MQSTPTQAPANFAPLSSRQEGAKSSRHWRETAPPRTEEKPPMCMSVPPPLQKLPASSVSAPSMPVSSPEGGRQASWHLSMPPSEWHSSPP
jgi:hypothetical protein